MILDDSLETAFASNPEFLELIKKAKQVPQKPLNEDIKRELKKHLLKNRKGDEL